MSTDATLTIAPAPEHGPGVRSIVLDCEHGRTEAAYANGTALTAAQLADAAVVQAVIARHYETERCRCTAALRKRYGLATAERSTR